MSEISLKVLEFDEQQKAIMAAALIAVAEESPLIQIDSDECGVINLISDSENEEDTVAEAIEAVVANRNSPLTRPFTTMPALINSPFFTETIIDAHTTSTSFQIQSVLSTGLPLAEEPTNIINNKHYFQQWLKKPNAPHPFVTMETNDMPFEKMFRIINPAEDSSDDENNYFNNNNLSGKENYKIIDANMLPISSQNISPFSIIYDLTSDDDDNNNEVNADFIENKYNVTVANEPLTEIYTAQNYLVNSNSTESEISTTREVESEISGRNLLPTQTCGNSNACSKSLTENSDIEDIKPFKIPNLALVDTIDLDDIDEETEQQIILLIESDANENDDDDDNQNNQSDTDKDTKPKASFNHEPRNLNNLIYYKCPKCGTSCGSFKKWRVHIEGEHNFRTIDKIEIRNIIDREGTLCYQCNICMKKMKNGTIFSRLLKHHFKHCPHYEYFKCRLCETYFYDASKTRRHLKQQHPKVCIYYMKRRSRELKHIRLHCPYCNKIIKNNEKLWVHMNEKHDHNADVCDKIKNVTDTIYKCTICNSKFKKSNCRGHLLLHKNNKMYHCNLCDDFSTNTLSTIIRHIRGKHMKIDMTKRYCLYCDEFYGTKNELQKHIVENHQIEKLQCKVCKRKFANSASFLNHMMLMNHQSLK